MLRYIESSAARKPMKIVAVSKAIQRTTKEVSSEQKQSQQGRMQQGEGTSEWLFGTKRFRYQTRVIYSNLF